MSAVSFGHVSDYSVRRRPEVRNYFRFLALPESAIIRIQNRRKVTAVQSVGKLPFRPGNRKAVDAMQENGTQPELAERIRFPEAVRLLWEGTRKAIDGGIDTKDLISLCDITVRLADHRLLFLQAEKGVPSAESQEAVNQLRHYRKLASDLLQWASRPMPEPDWAVIAEQMASPS
jgi:hypothetical protein